MNTLIQAFGTLSAVIGISVLFEWITGLSIFGPHEAQLPMAPSTALFFVLYGSVVFIRARNPLNYLLNRIEVFISSIITLVALLLLFLSIQGIHLNAEHLGMHIHGTVSGRPIGFMSPLTATCFIFAGFSFLKTLFYTQKRSAAVILPGCLIILINFVLLMANFWGMPLLSKGNFIPPALSTSVAFITLGIALSLLAGHKFLSKDVNFEETDKRSERILILVYLILAAGIISTGYFYFLNYRRSYRAEVERGLSSIAELKMSVLRRWRRERLGDAAIFYRNSDFSELVQRCLENPKDTDSLERVKTWFRRLNTDTFYDRVLLTDTKGRTRISVPDTQSAGAEPFLQDISEALTSKKITFLDFRYYSDQDRRVCLAILVPILNPRDSARVTGMLVMSIDPHRYIYPFIQRWPTSTRTAETLLIRREGNDALFLNDLRFQNVTALSLRIPLSRTEMPAVKAVLGETGIVEGKDYRGVPVIADVRAIPDSPWFLVARIDAEEVYAPLRAKLLEMLVIVSMLLIGAGAGVDLVRRRQLVRIYKTRYETAEALRTSEERYRRTLDAMMEGCQILSFEWRYLYVNDAAAGQGHATREELTGHSMIEKYPGIESTELFGILRRCMEERTAKIVENEFVYNDGTKRWFNLSIQPAPEGIFILSLDITGQKLIEETIRKYNTELEQRVAERTAQLETINKELEAFSYSVSHDLRTPLRAINGFSTILLEDYNEKLDDEGRRVLNVIRENVSKMGDLINDILNISRVSRQDIKRAVINMEELVQNVYEELKPGFPAQNAKFHLKSLPAASGDPKMIIQVFANLLSNAFKFTGKNSNAVIEVSGWHENNENIYCVNDNGVGFDMQYAQKLFNVFQRLHDSDEFEGTGIGLAIVKRIINKHGGRVWAEGKVNEGSTFYFSLPTIGEKSNESV